MFVSILRSIGTLIALPERVFCERYRLFGFRDRVTPSWPMAEAIACALIGRSMIPHGCLALGPPLAGSRQ